MKLEIDMPEHHYNNIIAFDSVSLGRVPYKGIIMYAINAIKHGKVLEQEPKIGHWIWELDETPSTPISPYELNYAGWVCSCCHEFPDDVCEWDDPDEAPTYKFCPNCGAKMVESQESEDT